MRRMNTKIIVRELSWWDRDALERHLLALGAEDRHLRFGISLSDTATRMYVSRIDFAQDAAFGVFDDERRLLGAAHLARHNGDAELGVSVLPGHRRSGLGGALLDRAHAHARDWGVHALFAHCRGENAAMTHLARSRGMEIVFASGGAEAWLKLPPAAAESRHKLAPAPAG